MSEAEGVALPSAGHPEHQEGLAKQFLVRFGLISLVLFTFPFPLEFLPGVGSWAWTAKLEVNRLVLAAARHVLPISPDIVVKPTGSGDTTADWLRFLACVLLAAAGAGIWRLTRRSPKRDESWVVPALYVWARYWVGLKLIEYGLMKVIPTQFAPADERELFIRIGDLSPMGLLWTFMRLCQPYVVLSGLAETIPGLLLCFRRTATLGALIGAAMLINVVALNFFFDVPVKLFSSVLLVTCLGLLLRDWRRLADFFWFHRQAAPGLRAYVWPRAWMRWAALGAKALVLGCALVLGIRDNWVQHREMGSFMNPALHGVYEVDSFVVSGTEHPPLMTDAARWRRVVAGRNGTYRVEYMDERQEGFRNALDEAKNHLVLTSWNGSAKGEFSLSRPEADRLVMTGQWNGEPAVIGLKRVPTPDFLLLSRPFRWVSEDPFNR